MIVFILKRQTHIQEQQSKVWTQDVPKILEKNAEANTRTAIALAENTNVAKDLKDSIKQMHIENRDALAILLRKFDKDDSV